VFDSEAIFKRLHCLFAIRDTLTSMLNWLAKSLNILKISLKSFLLRWFVKTVKADCIKDCASNISKVGDWSFLDKGSLQLIVFI